MKQSVLAALQPLGQDVEEAAQTPEPLHTVALVLVVPEHDAAAPQAVFAALLVVGLHTITPVSHAVTPFLHGMSGGSQAMLGVQAPQIPVRQNRFVPHIAPSPALVQAPEPLQVPVWQLAVVQPESRAAAGLLVQVPVEPILQA